MVSCEILVISNCKLPNQSNCFNQTKSY